MSFLVFAMLFSSAFATNAFAMNSAKKITAPSFKRFLARKSGFMNLTLTNLEPEQQQALIAAQLPQGHYWRRAKLGALGVKRHVVDGPTGPVVFYEKSNGLTRFLARFAVEITAEKLGLEGIILPRAFIRITDSKSREVFIKDPEELDDGFSVSLLVTNAERIRGAKLSAQAAQGLGELLWYVHLDIGADAQNVYLDGDGRAVIIDCEDKGEHWITNVQKLWTRFPKSKEALVVINKEQLPDFRRCLGLMMAKYIRNVKGSGFVVERNAENQIISFSYPRNGWFNLPQLTEEDDAEFGDKYYENEIDTLILAITAMEKGYGRSPAFNEPVVAMLEEYRDEIQISTDVSEHLGDDALVKLIMDYLGK